MTQRFYPGVLERDDGGAFGVWFPDFPGVVAAARLQEEAIALAADALAQGAEDLAFDGRPMPEPTPFDEVTLPKGCDLVALVAIGLEPPDQSERVNVYLPRSLIKRVDTRAGEIGMSRSSFFGFAVSLALGTPGSMLEAWGRLAKGREMTLTTRITRR